MINDLISKYKIENIIGNIDEIEICSRLMWKNIVYYCRVKNKEYSIKIYSDINNSFKRRMIEKEMYSVIPKFNINVPKIIYCKGDILITEWIRGNSLKELVNMNGVKKQKNKIIELLKNYEDIWEYDGDINLLQKNKMTKDKGPGTFYTRTNHTKGEIFSKFRHIKGIDILEEFYDIIQEKEISTPKIINSDISLYEVIYNESGKFWIDFESFSLGDPNNDLAGIFYSLSNSIIDKKEEIQCLFDIIKNNKYFNYDKFIFYLIERVLSASYLQEIYTINEELNFFIDFILKILAEK